jgi:hypothetical protein
MYCNLRSREQRKTLPMNAWMQLCEVSGGGGEGEALLVGGRATFRRPCWVRVGLGVSWRVRGRMFYTGAKGANRYGISGGRFRSRGRFATPADFTLQDYSPYRGLRVRCRGLGFLHRSRTIFCRPVPNLNVTIRNCCIAVCSCCAGSASRRRRTPPPR